MAITMNETIIERRMKFAANVEMVLICSCGKVLKYHTIPAIIAVRPPR